MDIVKKPMKKYRRSAKDYLVLLGIIAIMTVIMLFIVWILRTYGK
jgi:hypothetical protein